MEKTEIPAAMKKFRLANGWGVLKMAEACGLTRQSIWLIETGRMPVGKNAAVKIMEVMQKYESK